MQGEKKGQKIRESCEAFVRINKINARESGWSRKSRRLFAVPGLMYECRLWAKDKKQAKGFTSGRFRKHLNQVILPKFREHFAEEYPVLRKKSISCDRLYGYWVSLDSNTAADARARMLMDLNDLM